MPDSIKPAVALVIITLFFSAALGFVYNITYDPIEAQKARNEAENVSALILGTEDTLGEDIADSGNSVTRKITCYADGEIIGYAIVAEPKGYSGAVSVMVGFNAEGELLGVQILRHTETPGLGSKATQPEFLAQYISGVDRFTVVKTANPAPGEIDAITSATITTNAVTEGVNDAIDYIREN